MSDYNSSLPIRTQSAGDAIVKVADATTPSQQLKVETDGSINTNTTFAPGAQVEITDGTDTLAINGDGSINATVSATNLDIRDLTFASDKVDASGSTLGANSGVDIGDVTINNAAGASAVNIQDGGNSITVDGSVTVSATDLDIRDLTHVSDSVKVGDGTDFLAVNGDGSINATVSATNLDIRDLTFASDKVDASGSTLGANSGVDIGDVTINNAAGASAVNIQDGGNSITVDGSVTVSATDLDIRDLTHVSDSVKIGDGTDFLAVNGDGSLNATVSATNLDIRDLTAASDNVAAWLKDEAGNAFSSTNPLPVSLVDYEGTEVNDYDTASAVAAAATSNHDYTASGAFKLRTIWASASGKMKVEVQIETGAATNVFNTAFVGFNSTSSPNIEIPIKDALSVASGARVRIIRTNKDNQAQDLYSTISGFLV